MTWNSLSNGSKELFLNIKTSKELTESKSIKRIRLMQNSIKKSSISCLLLFLLERLEIQREKLLILRFNKDVYPWPAICLSDYLINPNLQS
jgi:Ran GTPase-activating protein (RanGAP) involved in mRNA processing and transport